MSSPDSTGYADGGGSPRAGQGSYQIVRRDSSAAVSPTLRHSGSISQIHRPYRLPASVSISFERGQVNSSPYRPTFMPTWAYSDNRNAYYNNISSMITDVEWVLESIPDLEWFTTFLDSLHTHGRNAVTKVTAKGFYWFGGITPARKTNPYLAFFATLPNLREVSVTLHAAALVSDKYSERDRLNMELRGLLERSCEKRPKRVDQVLQHYGLNQLFNNRNIHELTFECQESQIVRTQTRSEYATVFWDICEYFANGFMERLRRDVPVKGRLHVLESNGRHGIVERERGG